MHPQPVSTPLERALWAMAREGLGNLRSLSETWVGPGGELTPLARETLAELEPILVERLEKLARATDEEERELTAGLSWAPSARSGARCPSRSGSPRSLAATTAPCVRSSRQARPACSRSRAAISRRSWRRACQRPERER